MIISAIKIFGQYLAALLEGGWTRVGKRTSYDTREELTKETTFSWKKWIFGEYCIKNADIDPMWELVNIIGTAGSAWYGAMFSLTALLLLGCLNIVTALIALFLVGMAIRLQQAYFYKQVIFKQFK